MELVNCGKLYNLFYPLDEHGHLFYSAGPAMGDNIWSKKDMSHNHRYDSQYMLGREKFSKKHTWRHRLENKYKIKVCWKNFTMTKKLHMNIQLSFVTHLSSLCFEQNYGFNKKITNKMSKTLHWTVLRFLIKWFFNVQSALGKLYTKMGDLTSWPKTLIQSRLTWIFS